MNIDMSVTTAVLQPMEMLETSELVRGTSGRCTYNPYTGEWGRGSWKIDKHGNPFLQAFLG